MKVEMKQHCTIQGQTFNFEKHKKTGVSHAPASFLFDFYFVALVLDFKAKILSITKSEIDELIAEDAANEEKLENLNPLLVEMLELVVEQDEVKSESENDEESNDDEDTTSDSDESSEGDNDAESEDDESSDESEDEEGSEEVEETKRALTELMKTTSVKKSSKKKKKKGNK